MGAGDGTTKKERLHTFAGIHAYRSSFDGLLTMSWMSAMSHTGCDIVQHTRRHADRQEGTQAETGTRTRTNTHEPRVLVLRLQSPATFQKQQQRSLSAQTAQRAHTLARTCVCERACLRMHAFMKDALDFNTWEQHAHAWKQDHAESEVSGFGFPISASSLGIRVPGEEGTGWGHGCARKQDTLEGHTDG
jgi:hypothetical protein